MRARDRTARDLRKRQPAARIEDTNRQARVPLPRHGDVSTQEGQQDERFPAEGRSNGEAWCLSQQRSQHIVRIDDIVAELDGEAIERPDPWLGASRAA